MHKDETGTMEDKDEAETMEDKDETETETETESESESENTTTLAMGIDFVEPFEEGSDELFINLLDEEEKRAKSLYICTEREDMSHQWSTIDAHAGLTVSVNKATAMNTSQYPSDLLKLQEYAIIVFKSHIYFIGGLSRDNNLIHSNRVFVFDMGNGSWSEDHPNMRRKRASPRLVAYNNTIYAFGFNRFSPDDLTSLPGKYWIEYYDTDSSQWKFLRTDPPQILLDNKDHHEIVSHVLYEKQDLVLFWVRAAGLYAYRFDTQNWISVQQPICDGPRWSTKVALVGNFLFWHFFGKIYVYDFIGNRSTKLYTLQYTKFVEPVGFDGNPSQSFLVSAGKGKLCLFRHLSDTLIESHTFTIHFSRKLSRLKVVLQGSSSFRTQGYQIQTVLEV